MAVKIEPPRCDWAVMPFKDKRRKKIWRCKSCGHQAAAKSEPACPCSTIETS